MTERLLTVKETAAVIGVNEFMVRHWIKTGLLPVERISPRTLKRVRVRASVLQQATALHGRQSIEIPDSVSMVMHERPRSERYQGVYFLRAAGLVKIGFSGNVVTRHIVVRAASPVPVEAVAFIPFDSLRAASEREDQLHLQFAASRQHGEWFTESPELLELIAAAAPWPASRRGEVSAR